MKRLAVDLVIINERGFLLRAGPADRDRGGRAQQPVAPAAGRKAAPGSVYVLRADLMSAQARALLQSVARIVLSARRGTHRRPARPGCADVRHCAARRQPARRADRDACRHFADRFCRHSSSSTAWAASTRTDANTSTSSIAAPGDAGALDQRHRQRGLRLPGFAEGSGYTWAGNSRENQLTPWSNDPVSDPPGEAIYVRDEASGELWTPTAQPIRDAGDYIARHGLGYSRFEHESHGIALDLLQFVPLADPVKISRLKHHATFRPAAAPVGDGLCGMGAWHVARRQRRHSSCTEMDSDNRGDARAQSLEHGILEPCGLCRPAGRSKEPGPATAPSSWAATASLPRQLRLQADCRCRAPPARVWIPVPRCRPSWSWASASRSKSSFLLGQAHVSGRGAQRCCAATAQPIWMRCSQVPAITGTDCWAPCR